MQVKGVGFSPCVALADLLRLHLLWCASSHHTALIPPRHTTIWASPSLTHSHMLSAAPPIHAVNITNSLSLSVLSRSQPLRLLLWRWDTKEFLAKREIERELCVCVWVERKTSSGYLMRIISLDGGKPNSFSTMRRTNHNIIYYSSRFLSVFPFFFTPTYWIIFPETFS